MSSQLKELAQEFNGLLPFPESIAQYWDTVYRFDVRYNQDWPQIIAYKEPSILDRLEQDSFIVSKELDLRVTNSI